MTDPSFKSQKEEKTQPISFNAIVARLNWQVDFFLLLTWPLALGLAYLDNSVSTHSGRGFPLAYRTWLLVDGYFGLGLSLCFLGFLLLMKVPNWRKVAVVVKAVLLTLKIGWMVIGLNILLNVDKTSTSNLILYFGLLYNMVFLFLLGRTVYLMFWLFSLKVEEYYEREQAST